MEISGVAPQQSPAASGTKAKSDPSAEVQKLEQQKKALTQELKKLEQGKQGTNSANNAKEKLRKQIQEIDQQIQVLRQQGTTQAQPVEEQAPTERPPRYDEYGKGEDESPGIGLYSVTQDEDGKPSILFDAPK